MTEVYVNGHLMDVEQKNMAIVLQANDVGEVKDRQSNYVMPFDFSDTPRNVQVLQMLGVKGSLSRAAYVLHHGKVVEDSVEIIPDGLVAISKKRNGKFRAHIYSGNIYIFNALGTKKVSELLFYDLNHGVNKENYINSFTNEEGYIYAVSDFGKFKPNTEGIEINYQVPSLFVHTIWSKIFEEAGIKYYGDIFESEKFKNKVITMYRGYNSEVDVITNPIDVTGNNLVQSATFQYNPNFTNPNFNHPSFSIILPGQANVIPLATATNDEGILIQATDAGLYEYSFDINTVVGEFSNFNAYLQILKFNGVTTDVIANQSLGQVTQASPLNQNVSGSILLDAGDQVIINITYIFELLTPGTAPSNTVTQTVNNFSFKNNQTLTTLDFRQYLGELTQVQFVKDIMQEFGLVHQKRRNELAYDFIQFEKLLNDKSLVDDWSSKYIRDLEDDQYKLGGYAQSNRFGYYYLENDSIRFADGILKIENETLPIEKTLVTRPYNAPTISGEKINGNDITYTPFWTIERNDDGTIKEYKPFQSKNYIAEVKHINVTIEYFLTNGQAETFSGMLPILDFSNLDYQKIVDENYKTLKATLDFNNVKNIALLLSPLDIQNINFLRTKHLSQEYSDFYMNRINYIDSKHESIVQLVKIKRTATFVEQEELNPSINISSFVFGAGNPFSFPFNDLLITYYQFTDISPVDATLTITKLTDSLANGGVPTGNPEDVSEYNITTETGVHQHLLNLLTDNTGWYMVQIKQGAFESNIRELEVVPAVIPVSISHAPNAAYFGLDQQFHVQFDGFTPTNAVFHLQKRSFIPPANIGSEIQIPLTVVPGEFVHDIQIPSAGFWRTWVTADNGSDEIASNNYTMSYT